MRKVPVLTVVSLAALLGLMVVPVTAATLFGNDTPDIKLKVGDKADAAFDLDNFFDSATQATISYSASSPNTVDANGMATVFGAAAPSKLAASFTASAGGESVTVNSVVVVSNFLIGNGPAIDDNNRIAGLAGGNIFYNGIVSGGSASSVKALVGRLADGKAVSPAAVSGGAALVATIGEVSLITLDTGLRQRGSIVRNMGAGKATNAGLTATLNADGSYKLAATSAFAAPVIVTLGVKAGPVADGVHLLAAPAVDLKFDAATLGSMPVAGAATVTFGNALSISAKAKEAVLVYANNPVTVGEYATISLDYQTDSTDINLAAIAFDGALAFQSVSYSNPGATNIEKGVVKNLAITVRSIAGKVIPALQVYANSGANVTISRLSVIKAGPLVDFALDPNAVAVSDSLAKVDKWAGDVLGQQAKGPAANAANHFASAAGAGSMLLAGKGAVSNAFITAALGKGTAVGECFVQRQGDADSGSAFTLIFTDGGANSFASFVPGASIPADSWLKVICTGTLSAPTTGFFVAQAAGVNAAVDDVCIRIITDKDSYFDATLLGL